MLHSTMFDRVVNRTRKTNETTAMILERDRYEMSRMIMR